MVSGGSILHNTMLVALHTHPGLLIRNQNLSNFFSTNMADFSRRQARAQPRYGDPSQGPRGGPSGDGFYDRYTDDFKRRRRSPFEEWK